MGCPVAVFRVNRLAGSRINPVGLLHQRYTVLDRTDAHTKIAADAFRVHHLEMAAPIREIRRDPIAAKASTANRPFARIRHRIPHRMADEGANSREIVIFLSKGQKIKSTYRASTEAEFPKGPVRINAH